MTSVHRTPNMQTPVPLDWRDLIASARFHLARQQPTSRAANHRAISTAYYAAYDSLCESNASVLVGQATNQAGVAAWIRVYRGSSHRHAVGNLLRHRMLLSPDGHHFALALNTLYQARIRADYNPSSVFDTQAAEHRLDQAEDAIERFVNLPMQERITIATITLLRDR